MVELEKVMHRYGVYPIDVNSITENVHYVTDGKNEFALKKSSLTMEMIPDWINVFHQTDQLNLPGILPVYLTKENELYCQMNELIYYLTPWIQPLDSELNLQHVFKHLGQIHYLTKHYQTISFDKTKSDFNDYLGAVEKNQHILHSSVEQFEKHKYMSPFELLVCTHYISLNRVSHTLKEFTKRFIEKQEEQTIWNVSLCHGNLQREHILQTNDLYFINWEKANYKHAVHDLSMLLKNIVTYHHASADTLIERFVDYMQENELSFTELYLLVIYLLDDHNYISILQRYLNRRTSKHNHESIIGLIKLLQQQHRQLMLGLKFSEFVDRKESESFLDDLES